MNHEKITVNFRYITPILGALTLCGIVFSLYKKPYRWDEAAAEVEILTKKSAEHDIALAVIVAQLKDMSRDLKEIKQAVR